MNRRDFLKTSTVFTGTAIAGLSGCSIRTEHAGASSLAADAMDEALVMTSKLGPFGNHAPMAVESLITLGRSDRVIPFIEKYKRRFSVAYPAPVAPIDPKNSKAALGRGERNLDWVNFFERELKENDWKAVLEKWTVVLAPGLCAAAGHGVIRTCHAARSLSHRQTDHRLHELAEGLGYWAAYYQPLPETRPSSVQNLSFVEAFQRVPILPDDRRRRGSIMEQLRALDDFREFSDVINYLRVAGSAEMLLSQLTKTLAQIYVERANDRNDLILLHAITAVSGIRSLLPHLSSDATRRVLIYGWQTAAGLVSISGNPSWSGAAAPGEIKQADLVERAVSSNEEHSIKFTEACIREHRLDPDPIYLQAAHKAVERLPRY